MAFPLNEPNKKIRRLKLLSCQSICEKLYM